VSSRKPAATAVKFRCAVNIRGGDFTGGRVTSSMYRKRDSDAQSLRPGVQDAGVRESSRQESRVYPRCVSTSRHIQEFRDAHKSVHVYVQESKILESERVHDRSPKCIQGVSPRQDTYRSSETPTSQSTSTSRSPRSWSQRLVEEFTIRSVSTKLCLEFQDTPRNPRWFR